MQASVKWRNEIKKQKFAIYEAARLPKMHTSIDERNYLPVGVNGAHPWG